MPHNFSPVDIDCASVTSAYSIRDYQSNPTTRFKNFLSPNEVTHLVTKVEELKSHWSPGYGGEQFSLGEVWYHHQAAKKSFEEYSALTSQSIEIYQKHLPWLYEKIHTFLTRLVSPEPLQLRPGWAGPGIVIFPKGQVVSNIGGEIHYDSDGMENGEWRNPEVQCFSFISMLSKPERGGELKVWDKTYHPDQDPDVENPSIGNSASFLVDYQPGEIVMISAMRAHQIQPFSGEKDRICLTFRLLKINNNWVYWF